MGVYRPEGLSFVGVWGLFGCGFGWCYMLYLVGFYYFTVVMLLVNLRKNLTVVRGTPYPVLGGETPYGVSRGEIPL